MSPLIGIAMFAMMPNMALEQTEFLLVTAALNYLHPFLTALFIAALTSALMSTSDSSILAGASVFTENIMPYLGKKLDEKIPAAVDACHGRRDWDHQPAGGPVRRDDL
jgi:Na+/proline symporter